MGFALRKSHDQKYLIAGYITSGEMGGKEGLIVKTSACGEYQWAFAIGSAGEDKFAELIATSERAFCSLEVLTVLDFRIEMFGLQN